MRLKALERKVLDLALDYGRAEDGSHFLIDVTYNGIIVYFFDEDDEIAWDIYAFNNLDDYGEKLLEIINAMSAEYKARLKKENRPADQSNGAVNNINFI